MLTPKVEGSFIAKNECIELKDKNSCEKIAMSLNSQDEGKDSCEKIAMNLNWQDVDLEGVESILEENM